MTRNREFERVVNVPENGTYLASYHYPSVPPSIAIPLAIADIRDADSTDLQPLRDAADVDIDAIDAIFRPSENGGCQAGQVQFTSYGYAVTINHEGDIRLHDLDVRRDATLN